jgi:hypothetical protein
MKKTFLKILPLFLLFVLIPFLFLYAQPPPTTVTIDNPLGEESILGIINRGLSVLLWLSMTLGVFVVM